MRVLLYGASGTGKTTLWATFPGPISVGICSGGNKPGELRSIDTPENRARIRPTVLNSSDEFRAWLEADGDCETRVLDHATGFADMILTEILGRPLPAQKGWGLASQQQYGQLALLCKEGFRSLLNLPCNVVIVAQERVFGGREDGGSEVIQPTVGAALTPSVTGWLNPACDYVLQTFKRAEVIRTERSVGEGKLAKTVTTETRTGKVEYCLRCEPHEVFQTKFRVPGGVKQDVIVNPSYAKLLAASKGETVG